MWKKREEVIGHPCSRKTQRGTPTRSRSPHGCDKETETNKKRVERWMGSRRVGGPKVTL